MSIKSYTIDELIAHLTKFPSDTKIFMSRDQEGNGYGSISNNSFEYNKVDEALVIFPALERLEFDEICPKASEGVSQV